MKSLLVGIMVAAMSFVGTSVVSAGTIQITQSGTASDDAEFVKIRVTVHSKCYPTSVEAATATATLANDIGKVMEPFAEEAEERGLEDPFTQVGGNFAKRDEYTRKGRDDVLLCSGWRTSKHLTLKLVDIEKLPTTQDTILALVDKNTEDRESDKAQTWAQWTAPSPAVTPKTDKALNMKALKNALDNAKAELAVIVEDCGLEVPRLTAVGPVGYAPRDYSKRLGEAEIGGELQGGNVPDTGSSFTFGKIRKFASRTFTFEFEGGLIDTCPALKLKK